MVSLHASHGMQGVAVHSHRVSVLPTLSLEKHFRHALEEHDNLECDRGVAPCGADWLKTFETSSDSAPVNPISSAYRCSKHVKQCSLTPTRKAEESIEEHETNEENNKTVADNISSTRLDIIKAVMVFDEVFPEALDAPTVPLMQLDADSLVLEELAQALNNALHGRNIKVMDMFSHNTCAKLLDFISSKE